MHESLRETGWVEVICGGMYSGKTEELIRRLRRAVYAKQSVVSFKPKIDTRYSETDVASHSGITFTGIPLANANEILSYVSDQQVVGIDEAQFFDDAITEVVQTLASDGKRVIVAGLDMDSKGEPFGPMPRLMAQADFVTKSSAICVVCGNPATRSQRTVRNNATILVGEKESYEARCRRCWNPS